MDAKIAPLECAPAGGQVGRFELTPFAGLPEDGSHDEAQIPGSSRGSHASKPSSPPSSPATLAEAGIVLAQSAKAALPQPVFSAAATPLRSLTTTQRKGPTAVTPPASAAPVGRSVRDFRVQGASPGLAVLNVIGAAPDGAPVLYLALGDQVPGVGRIKSIYQRGTTWLVQTDAGVIQSSSLSR